MATTYAIIRMRTIGLPPSAQWCVFYYEEPPGKPTTLVVGISLV